MTAPSLSSLVGSSPEVEESTAVASTSASTPTEPAPGPPIRDSSHPLFAAKARGFRGRMMRFTPSWFSVVMGTGIVNTLLFNLPWAAPHPAFSGIGTAFLLLDIVLFLSFSVLTVGRYTLYPKMFKAMIGHEVHSLFLGTIPMGLVTITSGIASHGNEYGLGVWTLDLAIVLWWISLVMSVLTSFVVPFIMFTRHNHTSDALTAAWLLPVVPPITIAAVGSVLCNLLIPLGRLDYALTIMITSYIMNGVGLLLASGLMVIYFQRLALHHLPGREVIVSSCLPMGPCGQGGYALIELGRVAVRLFPKLLEANPGRTGLQDLAGIGPALFGAGLMTGLLLWGLGVWWMALAAFSIGSNYISKTLAFNMGWWAFTFPLGSLALLTFSLGTTFDSLFFNVVAAIMTFVVLFLWTIIAIPTAIGFFRGTLFPAPCLASLPPAYVETLPRGKAGGGEEGRKQ